MHHILLIVLQIKFIFMWLVLYTRCAFPKSPENYSGLKNDIMCIMYTLKFLEF